MRLEDNSCIPDKISLVMTKIFQNSIKETQISSIFDRSLSHIEHNNYVSISHLLSESNYSKLNTLFHASLKMQLIKLACNVME